MGATQGVTVMDALAMVVDVEEDMAVIEVDEEAMVATVVIVEETAADEEDTVVTVGTVVDTAAETVEEAATKRPQQYLD